MSKSVSRNQLAEWKHFEQSLSHYQKELEKINDYFDCLIECEDNAPTCKRFCRYALDD